MLPKGGFLPLFLCPFVRKMLRIYRMLVLRADVFFACSVAYICKMFGEEGITVVIYVGLMGLYININYK